MEHLIPTLLGIAGALAPVALSYWKQESPVALRQAGRAVRFAAVNSPQLAFDDAIVRGGRVYL